GELELLSGWLGKLGRWMAAEALWSGELAADPDPLRRLWLDEQLHDLYRDALLADGELSLGRGVELYRAVVASFLAALAERTNADHAQRLVSSLCGLWSGTPKRPLLADLARTDAADFAFAHLPALLDRYQYRSGQDVVAEIANCLGRVEGPRTELAFLTARTEDEPSWLRWIAQDFWSRHAYRYGAARVNAGALDPLLGQRVLAVVLRALREDLRTRRASSRNVYSIRYNHFWAEKRGDFLATAQEVLEGALESGATVDYVARYLFEDLHAFDEAIAALQGAYRADRLGIDARRVLCVYLQRRERWGESVEPLRALVVDQPEAVENRVMLMRAVFELGESVELVRTLEAAEAWLRENDAWDERPIAALAAGCLATDLNERGIALFDEAIALHVRSAPARGVGDGVLSGYYREKASACSALGRTDDAVDAAAGAIVSWGRDHAQREVELARLEQVLTHAPDLDAYIGRLDSQVARTGLENPIVRKAVARALVALQRPGDALVQFRLALAAQPNDTETMAELVRALDACGRAEEAAQAALERARRAGHDVGLWRELGRRLAELERADESERAHTNLAEVLPNESEGHRALAEVRQAQGRWEEAAESWSQVSRVRSSEPTGDLGRTRCLIELGRTTEARRLLESIQSTEWPERFGSVKRDVEALRQRMAERN
ncbi:MAG TPA: hypothetical protein VMT18_14395, partial [Planctomycetota bacterium]|nr:hypothetical protein [Planctomycetota bacterium]